MRVLPDGAGVHEDHVGALAVFGKGKPLGFEQRAHQFGVVLIHLTPEGLDMDSVWGRRLLHALPTSLLSCLRAAPSSSSYRSRCKTMFRTASARRSPCACLR